jgi:spore coat protein U-like protein
LTLPFSASALCLLCSCSTSTTAVAFGVYNPLSVSNIDAVGNIRITCNGVLNLSSVDYSIAINKGLNSSGFSPRVMASGANHLNYDLYTNSTRTTIWGDGTGSTQVVADSLTVPALFGTSNKDNTVYGRIPGSQSTTRTGSYNDSITVTITYN